MKGKEIGDIMIQVYDTMNEKTPMGVIRLEDFILGKGMKNEIIRGRYILSQTKKEDYKEVKSNWKHSLPVGVPSALCSDTSKDDVLEIRNIILLDLDKGDNNEAFKDADSLMMYKAKLACLPFVYAVSLSASGTGLYAVAVTDTIWSEDDYKEVFNALVEQMDKLGLHCDKNCGNTNRVRFASWDMKPIIKNDEEIEPFTDRKKNPTAELALFMMPSFSSSEDVSGIFAEPEFFKATAEYIKYSSEFGDLQGKEGYNKWFSIACYCASFPDTDAGIEAFDIISQAHPDYPGRDEIVKKFNQGRLKTAGGSYLHLYGVAKRMSKRWVTEVKEIVGGSCGGGLKGLM